LDGLVAFNSKKNEILFEIETGEKANIFYPGGGRASVESKAGMIDVRTKLGNINVESGESAGVSEDAVTGEVTIIAEIGIIEHETTAGTVKIRESGSVTAKEDSSTGEIMVTDTDDGITITTIDGTTTEIAVGSSLGALTEIDTPATENTALTPAEEIDPGDIASDATQKNIDHSETPGNDTASSIELGLSTQPGTNYLLDFAKKIMVTDTDDDINR